MKIYFTGAICGGRADIKYYQRMIKYCRKFGRVLTEHVGDAKIGIKGEDLSDQVIHQKDLRWLKSADVIISEVTTPSLGVGYEIGRAVGYQKPILCLHRKIKGKRASAMILGCPQVKSAEYSTVASAEKIIDKFFKNLK